ATSRAMAASATLAWMRLVWPMLLALGCRDRDVPKPTEPPAQPAAVAHAERVRPVLPTPEEPRRAPTTPDEVFTAEVEDAGWAVVTERTLRARVPPDAAIACRRTLCRVTVLGRGPELAAAVDRLEALRDIARSVQLSAPPPDPDGKRELRAYLR